MDTIVVALRIFSNFGAESKLVVFKYGQTSRSRQTYLERSDFPDSSKAVRF